MARPDFCVRNEDKVLNARWCRECYRYKTPDNKCFLFTDGGFVLVRNEKTGKLKHKKA